MTIRYALFETQLAGVEPGAHVAVVQSAGTAEMEDVIDRMIEKGSTITRADIVGVLEDYYTTVEHLLLEGKRVRTPVANFSTSVRGLFDGPTDTFDRSRHRIAGIVNPGRRLRAAIQNWARASKQEASLPTPNPVAFIDANTGEKNTTLTPGGLGQLMGHRLKIADPADPAQGIFFVGETGDETRVSVIANNTPRGLTFLIPEDLPAGQYRVAVRSLFGENTVREGILKAPLMAR